MVVIERFRPVVPRGITCEGLAREGRLLSLTNEEVRREVSSGVKCSPYVTLLDASGGTLLYKCDDQNIDGARAVEHKGALCMHLLIIAFSLLSMVTERLPK